MDGPQGMAARVFSPRGELWGAIAAGVLLAVGWVGRSVSGGGGGVLAGVFEGLVWLSLGVGSVYGARAAWGSLAERKVDIDVLMIVGALLAAATGAPAEGSLLLFLFTLAGALEALAMARTTRAVEALGRLMPTSTQRWEGGAWRAVAPEALTTGDRVRVLGGELVPADAVVSAGATSVDQSSLTGESAPRDVTPGDEVFSGTLNVGEAIEATVLRPAAQSSLQKIVDLVTVAQQQREPVQRVIDRLSQPYAVGVFAASLVVLLVWRYGLGLPWVETGAGGGGAGGGGAGGGGGEGSAVYAAIALLIVASPCALVIATPTATLAGISRGARAGVLFKGGQAIERLARLRAVAFDKTGTLTIGRPRVLQVHPVGWSDGRALLSVAAALEAESTHPIARAVLECAQRRGVTPARAEQIRTIAGRGVSAMVRRGGGVGGGGAGEVGAGAAAAAETLAAEARLGSLAHTEELIPVCLRARVRSVLETVQGRGQIAVVCVHGEDAGVIVLSDATRPGAERLVSRLHALGVRPVVMLTGDHASTARRVGAALGLDEVHAQLLPADKVEHVRRLKTAGREAGTRAGAGGGVGVIGDGVNDAPALAAADVSIAIGSIGSDAALESADAVLLADDLSVVPWAVTLARRVRRTIYVNLIFAGAAIVIMALAVLLGPLLGFQIPLWLGVLGHEGGTMLVVAHSLLLLTFPAEPAQVCDRAAGGRDASAASAGETMAGATPAQAGSAVA